jgi:hypothetical protein
MKKTDYKDEIPLAKKVSDHNYVLEGCPPMLWKQPFNQKFNPLPFFSV